VNGRHVVARARARMRRTISAGRPDIEIRQLRALQAAYGGAHDGPEVLLIGDSAMLWVGVTERDTRTLAQMIKDCLPDSVRVHAMAGPGYNPRIINVFLEALAHCPSRPKVIVLPASLLMATKGWSTHPTFSYIRETPELRRILHDDDRRARRLPRATDEDWEEWDRQPLPSLFGARRTMGEARMITQSPLDPPKWAPPVTRFQRALRMRHMLDLYNAERLTAESPGVTLLTDMGHAASKLGIPSVAYISPVNREVLVTVFKEPVVEHLETNAEVMTRAYLDAAGPGHRVVNALLSSSAADFGDPVHLNGAGRLHLARLIADDVQIGLDQT
jgi:hypothetical protein